MGPLLRLLNLPLFDKLRLNPPGLSFERLRINSVKDLGFNFICGDSPPSVTLVYLFH
jgi:hypothetical protein